MNTDVHKPPHSVGRFNLRAYLAGGAATTALIVCAIVVFGLLAAYVSFNGLPVGGDDDGAGEVVVGPSSAAPEAKTRDGAARDAGTPAPATSRVTPPAPGDREGGGGDAAPSAPATPQSGAGVPATAPAEEAGTPGGEVGGGAGASEAPLGDLQGDAAGPIGGALGSELDAVGGALEDVGVGGHVDDGAGAAGGRLGDD